MSYSQNDEEAKILAHFESKPPAARRFLDIGAHDGVGFSNTRRLAELGWTGTLIEPSPSAFIKLMDLYQNQPEMQLVHAALVPDASRLLRFYDSRGDFVSTFDERQRAVWAMSNPRRAGVPYQPIYVAAMTCKMLFETLPGPYPFVNLDVEGINWELFQELPLQELGVEVACVEYQEKLDEIEQCAARQGYARVHRTSENIILVRA